MKTHILDNYKFAKLFIIEENDDHWVVLKNALQDSLPQVKLERVASAREALTLIEGWSHQEWELPKLILLDLNFPNREDIWHLIQQIRNQSSPVRYIPMLVLTSSGSKEDIQNAYQLGVSSCLEKPDDFENWMVFAQQLRQYWWETVTLPPIQFNFDYRDK